MNEPSHEALPLNVMLIRNPDIFASEIDDEMVMMDDAQGLYFGLNSVARKIWNSLETPRRYEILLNALLESYEVDIDQCRADVEPFLLKMIEHGLVRIASE